MKTAIFIASFIDDLPTPEVLSGYEKLGIVGVLLLLLFVMILGGGAFATTAMIWASRFAKAHLEQMAKQTHAGISTAVSNNELRNGQNELHRRLDQFLNCGAGNCPVRAARNNQQPANQT